MSDLGGFYRAFEDRERGSKELILKRLDVYRPLLESIVERTPAARSLDIGCGRGEWLQLLKVVGIEGHGVDLDNGMLAACREAALSVEQGDALEWLAAQPDNSLALITAFHVVEHIPFVDVQQMVEQAHRVLQPGGVLILETPNPENLSVGAHTFYLDPTHERPVPPALLKFVPEFVGFERTWLWRLQEAERLVHSEEPVLSNVLLAVSPDYAVIARKAGGAELDAFDALLEQPRGWGLEKACEQYDAVHKRQLMYATDSVAQLREQGQVLEQQVTELLGRLERVEQSTQQLEQQTLDYQYELAWVKGSFSWRLTYPLRWTALQWRLVREQGAKHRVKAAIGRVAAPALRILDRSTRKSLRLRHALLTLARKLGIHHRVVRYYQFTRVQHAAKTHDGRIFELSESQKRLQSAWLTAARKLPVDELLLRIRKELDAQATTQSRK